MLHSDAARVQPVFPKKTKSYNIQGALLGAGQKSSVKAMFF
jgi:hypothetical protein